MKHHRKKDLFFLSGSLRNVYPFPFPYISDYRHTNVSIFIVTLIATPTFNALEHATFDTRFEKNITDIALISDIRYKRNETD